MPPPPHILSLDLAVWNIHNFYVQVLNFHPLTLTMSDSSRPGKLESSEPDELIQTIHNFFWFKVIIRGRSDGEDQVVVAAYYD